MEASAYKLLFEASFLVFAYTRVYAIWPFYGRFDGSPDSGAIVSTVEFTSSTQGTAGAPAVDFFDGRFKI